KQTNKKHRVSGRVKKILKKINSLSGHMAELSDQQLASLTDDFQARLKKGSSLDDLLPEAFAAIREADKRVLGMYPFDVQVLGAIVLHQGDIAEMKTGEGKTLTATMPLYLNALSKKGAVLVTSNAYLAEVGVDQMGPVYRFMGLSVGLGASEKKISIEEKQTIYRSDILYTTNYALGFDYLIDNLASSKEGKFMRPFNYVLIDEVDSVLLDSAQTPLVISGSPRVQSNLYEVSDDFIQTLKEGRDFKLDKERKNVWLTNKGCDLAEKYFNINNLFTAEFTDLARHIELALRVHYLFILNRDYVVEDDQVKLLDAVNGRVMENTKLQSGLHQAIEAKEHLKLSSDTRSMASITYQNLFRMFKKISGMTGTAMSDQQEFLDTYNMRVISIPTNKPMIRKDHLDRLYPTLPAKIAASVDFIKKIHATGRPILLATGSVRMSEIYSNILLKEGIAHSVLNAYNIAKEAQIIAESGRFGTVTVATSMAGRGTDIKIDEKTRQAGGLYVIATEHLKNSRMDDQLRGRAGRQGDPGSSIFFCSLEDDLL
ncbi:preprotein translocase subunit SecA, partial [Oenococcus alcoholitolerans]